MENQKQIVETWVKLERCLNEFDIEQAKKTNRPMSSAPQTKFQIKRPGSSMQKIVRRPQTSQPFRPQTAQNRPMTAASIAQSRLMDQVINGLPMEQIKDLYIARCKDTQVDLLESQSNFFVGKFKVACVDRTFDLTEHNIGPITAKVIDQVLLDNPNFLKLELGKNNLADEGVIPIAHLLANNKHIIHADLSSNNITDEGVKILSEALMQNNTLISLSLKSYEGLNRNKVGGKGCVHLKKLLLKTKTLMYLNMSATQIGLVGLKTLCEGLRSNCSLLHLDISNNYLGPNLSKFLSGTLSASCLEELNLANNKLTDVGMANLAPLFGKLNTNSIRKLNLTNNSISSAGLAKLFEALYDNKTIQDLILDHNNFVGSGVFYYLNTLLLETQSLRVLSFEKCDIEKYIAEEIKAGLTRNATLTHLILRNNSLYDEGCEHLCDALHDNTRLKLLDISDNKLREKSGAAIGNMLKKNRYLE
jgi:Ran GTPase-activating protein (RanGAP) involved in mRNA processing and transport